MGGRTASAAARRTVHSAETHAESVGAMNAAATAIADRADCSSTSVKTLGAGGGERG